MRILKFGGKSLSSTEKTQNICKFIKKIYKKEKNIIIIVSARDKTTDELTNLAGVYARENSPNKRELATLLSTGETVSASLLAIMLCSMDVPAKSFQAFQIEALTFGDTLDSKIAYINKKPLEDCLSKGVVAVVAGFQGINGNNETTLLGRGGSDTTATAIGAIFDSYVEIYSDFKGVCAGDPRLLPFKQLKSISHSAMESLALSGAKVLEKRAVSIAKKFNIDIVSKSSTNPLAKGTTITNLESDIVAISSKDNLCEITVVFTNKSKLKFIVKNVIDALCDVKFYNLTCKNDKISFLINSSCKIKVLQFLSEKLNLLQK